MLNKKNCSLWTGNSHILAISLVVVLLPACSPGQSAATLKMVAPARPDQALFDTIAFQDSLLFAAFNARDAAGMKAFFSSNLEIYQDNAGLRNYQQAMDAFQELFQKDYVLTRSLVAGSLEIYPIKDYGAIETGQHTFCHTEQEQLVCGTFKFVHIWQKQDGKWRITRIVTYDH